MVNIKVNIICNLKNFFTCKSIKYDVFQKMIFNIKNLNIRAVEFGAHVNKVSLYIIIYIKS